MARYARRIVPFALLGAVLCALASSDTLYLREGEQEPGRLVAMTRDLVRFEGRGGVKTLKKSDVLKIQLQRARRFDDVETVEQITDPDLKACLESQPSGEEFPAAGSVTLLWRHVYDLTEPGFFRDTERKITKVLRQRGEDEATTNVWYFEDTDLPRIDFALTVTPDGRVLHLSDAALKNESIYARFPDYRRLARFRFANKEPRPGSVLDVQYTVVRNDRGPLEPFYAKELFRDDRPILRKEVVVLVPEANEARVAAQVYGPDVVEQTREVSDGVVRLSWRLTEAQLGIVPEPLMPPKQDFVPLLALGEAATWEEVIQTYAEALAKLPPLPQDLVEKAIALDTENGPEAIHNFVARTVRTAPVPHRHYRLLPHPAEDSLRRALANELDKNFLYFKMLEAAGIKCAFALVRGRNQGPLADNVPSLLGFDRSAVYVKKDGRFSTVSSDVLSFATLPGALHAAPALVIEADGGLLTRTQRPCPESELDATEFDAALDAEGNLQLEVTYRGTGNAGTWMRDLKDADAQKLRNVLEQIAGRLHPAARLTDYTTTELADLGIAPAVTLRCVIPGYAVKAGEDLMLFDLPAVAYTARDVGRPVREHGLYWSHVLRETSRGSIRIPEGFQVHSMPGPVMFDSVTAAYEASLGVRGDTVGFEDTYALKVHDAPATAYADFKTCKELRAGIPRQRVILTR